MFMYRDTDTTEFSKFNINQSLVLDHLEIMDFIIAKEKREEAKNKLLSLATGFREAHKNIKKHKGATIEQFEKVKEAIIKARPSLEKYNAEAYLKKANEEERIEFFKLKLNDRFPWDEYDVFNTPDNGDKVMISIPEIRNSLPSKTTGVEDHTSKSLSANFQAEDPAFLGKIKSHMNNINPSYFENSKIKDEELVYILSQLNSEINYSEAYYSNKIYSHEEKLGEYRFASEVEYMTRGDSGVVDWDVVHRYRENEMILKQTLELTYRPDFKKLIKSYAKTLDNKRVDVGMIMNRPPIFLHIPKNEIEYTLYKNNFQKKYGVNIEPMLEELDAHNINQDENWKSSEKFHNDDPNSEPIIRKKRSKTELTALELRNLSEVNYDYMNSYLLKDNLPDDPYNTYSLNCKHYLRVDPNIHDPKNIQTDSCWDVYFICKNKITGDWEFPTKSVINGVSLKETVEWLIVDLTKKSFDIFLPREYHPVAMLNRNFYNHEKKDERNDELLGVRTYYYIAHHDIGAPSLFINDMHPYEDWLMAKKDDLHKYFKKDYYQEIVKFLH